MLENENENMLVPNKLTTPSAWFSVFSNEMTGTLPTEYGGLSGMSTSRTSISRKRGILTHVLPLSGHLDFDRNNLVGTIPSELGALSLLGACIG